MTIIFDEDKQNKKVDDLRKAEEENVTRILSEKYQLPYLDLTLLPINPDALRLIDESRARDAKIVIFNAIGKKIEVAMLAPEKAETLALVHELENRGYQMTSFLVSNSSLVKAWERYKDISFSTETKAGALDISNEAIVALLQEVHSLEDIKKQVQDILATKKGFRISRILEIIIAGGLATGASDIHYEPEETSVRLRFRLDGVLVDIIEFDVETYTLLLSRIKLLSGLKLNIKSNAQDGRFSVIVDASEIEIRTSILPGAYNESIVLRLLNPKSIAVPIEALGIEPKLLAILQKEIAKPNGMILTTGPTGSGKTTTLYAFLRKVSSPENKIITIEDPIEYHLPGIVQTQVNIEKEYTFLNGLRSALRQDPDIIMVGEIRDSETAEIAINSALTGHLVFSTLHTNNAAGAFPRLIDLGVNPKVMTSAINVTLAQRLVRTLCKECKKQIPLEGEMKTLIEKIFTTIQSPEYKTLQTQTIFAPAGCTKCNNSGYKGRIGIYEAILTDSAIEKVINENPSEREIATAALPQGIPTMEQDGIVKILKGLTTLEELQRVIEIK